MKDKKPDYVGIVGPYRVLHRNNANLRSYAVETVCCGRRTNVSQSGITQVLEYHTCGQCREAERKKKLKHKVHEDVKKPFGLSDPLDVMAMCRPWRKNNE